MFESTSQSLKISDWVLVKAFQSTSRVVDIQQHPDGHVIYGVLDFVERIHFFKADELTKLKEDTQ